MQLFYQNNIVNNTTCVLNEEESRHIAQVLRLKVDNTIQITNGKGSLFTARLIEIHHKKCVINVLNETLSPKAENFSLHLAIAPTKNMDRMEWFVEKAVELGIDEITPVICNRSERKEIKIDRLIKVAVAAMKQSLKFNLPQINEATTFEKFISLNGQNQGYICFGNAEPANSLHSFSTNNQHNTFLIGPEGDFTPNEILKAAENGYKPINLGPSRLRTETAALHVVSIVNFKKSLV
jgi:16S rRNA (uracil1498-N3)-methyltransferase